MADFSELIGLKLLGLHKQDDNLIIETSNGVYKSIAEGD